MIFGTGFPVFGRICNFLIYKRYFSPIPPSNLIRKEDLKIP